MGKHHGSGRVAAAPFPAPAPAKPSPPLLGGSVEPTPQGFARPEFAQADSGHAKASSQLARFACVGVSNTVLSYVVYATLVALDTPYLAAGALAFAVGAVNGYRLNRRWTFRASDSLRPRVRYGAVQAAGLAATTGLLWLIVSVGGMHRLAGYLVTIPLVTVATFAANRSWTFAGMGPADRTASSTLRPAS